jgi:hypothetical protein
VERYSCERTMQIEPINLEGTYIRLVPLSLADHHQPVDLPHHRRRRHASDLRQHPPPLQRRQRRGI